MIGIRTRLLSATALAVIFIQPVFAQDASDANKPAGATASQGAGSSKAPKSKEPVKAEDILETVVVTGQKSQIVVPGGRMIVQRQPEATNSITAEAIQESMGISGPYQLAASLPGVNTGQSDPYQMSIRYGLQLRGLPFNKIGWTVEGMPPMDRAYLNPYSESYTDTENLAGLTIHPGSADITDPVQTAVGGEFSLTLRDPHDEPGGQVSYSYGSYHGERYFGGIDTGLIGNTGIKAFATISETTAGSFALPSDAIGSRLHTDVKVEKEWGDLAKSSIWVSYNDWTAVRSQAFTLAQFQTAQQTGNYTTANYTPTFDPTSNSNNYYKLAEYTRRNVMVAWNNEIALTDSISIHVTPYFQYIQSNSPGESTLNPASAFTGNQQQTISTAGLFLQPNGLIPVKSNVLQYQYAEGVNSTAKVDISPTNSLTFGWWFDHFNMRQLNSFSPVSGSGNAVDWAKSIITSTTGQPVSGASYNFLTNINALYVQDQQSFLDNKLKVEVGLKYFIYRLSGNNFVPGPQTGMTFSYEKLLPRATISYDIDNNTQVYANAITETRTNAPITTYVNTYNVANGTVSQGGNPNAKPEYSFGQEIGLRYHDDIVTSDFALFNKKLENNSVTSLAFLNGAGVNSTLSAGGLEMKGVTAEVAVGPFFGFTPYVNGQYLATRDTSTFQVGNDFLPTIGKEGVQAPKYTGTVGLNYDDGQFFGNVLYKYVGSQFATFMNDQKMPSFSTVDLGVGYHIPAGYIGKEPVIRLSMTNLGDKPYLGAFSSVQPNAVTTTGVNGTVIAGKAPSYWLSSPLTIMMTISTTF